MNNPLLPSGSRSPRTTLYRIVRSNGMRTDLCRHVPKGNKLPPVPEPGQRFVPDDVQGEGEVIAE